MPSNRQPGTAVAIRGDGVAACCCAHLLGAAGVSVAVERLDRVRVPAIMLSDATQMLIGDVFAQGDLFGNLPRIDKRIVAWGPHAQTRVLPHSAAIVSEQELTKRLLPKLPKSDSFDSDSNQWTIFASRPLPQSAVEHHFGSRIAAAQSVALKRSAERSACWVESLENGWLFLVPAGDGSAWLLAVGETPELLLERSRLIAMQIEAPSPGTSHFPAYPRIAYPLCGPGWLACGTAALAFDPLCGDGTGHAIREAILASAVIKAAPQSSEPDDLLAHYRARLLAGFRRHLELCRDFYLAGRSGPWWDAELDLLRKGIEWCAREMEAFPSFRYQLRGFELQALNLQNT
ncbi:MAG: hypothetical protein JWO80_3517 [Bryobacterales bacterium]|nr:hypothetical protein [Bryobacterales bacterium]